MIGGSTAIAVVVVRPLAYEVATLRALEEVPSLAGDGGVVLVGEGQQVVEDRVEVAHGATDDEEVPDRVIG